MQELPASFVRKIKHLPPSGCKCFRASHLEAVSKHFDCNICSHDEMEPVQPAAVETAQTTKKILNSDETKRYLVIIYKADVTSVWYLFPLNTSPCRPAVVP